MAMLPENLPAVEIGMTVVRLSGRRGSVVRVWCLMRDGERHTLKQWECPQGRPDESQSLDITAYLGCEATLALLTFSGLQGSLLG